ncbi:MAG: histidine phosphatase family protein [Rubrivivax sp.]
MLLTQILAIRHGQTDWNAHGRIQGHLDIGLNDAGREQARRLGDALLGQDVAAVYSSDLQRARETAAEVSRATGAGVVLEPALRERAFGVFEGLTHTEIEQRWPEEVRRWRQRDPAFAAQGGETLVEFHARCVGAAQRLAGAHRGEVIALVAHGGVMDALYRAALRLPPDAPRTWALRNASINRLLHGEEGFGLVGWDDGAHLPA